MSAAPGERAAEKSLVSYALIVHSWMVGSKVSCNDARMLCQWLILRLRSFMHLQAVVENRKPCDAGRIDGMLAPCGTLRLSNGVRFRGHDIWAQHSDRLCGLFCGLLPAAWRQLMSGPSY